MSAAARTSSFMVCGTRFDIDAKYSLIKPIGQGAYGVVWYAISHHLSMCAAAHALRLARALSSANDTESNRKVAIKKITRAFDHLTDGKRTLREIKLLRHFEHENVRLFHFACQFAGLTDTAMAGHFYL